MQLRFNLNIGHIAVPGFDLLACPGCPIFTSYVDFLPQVHVLATAALPQHTPAKQLAKSNLSFAYSH